MEGRSLSSRALLGAVVRRAATLDRRSWAYMFVLALIVFVPVGVIQGSFDVLAENRINLAVAAAAVSVGASALIGEVFYSGAVAGLIAKTPEAERPSLVGLARRLPLLRLLAADVLVTVLVIVGLLLLIVPGVVLFVLLAFVAPSIEIEERTLRSGFKRSRELVRGRFWLVLLVVGGLELTTELAVQAIEGLTHSVLGDALATDSVAETLGNVLTNPPYAVVIVLLALELMREKPAPAAELA